MIDVFYFFSLFFIIIFSLVVAYNFFTAPTLKKLSLINHKNELISVLIPARNEQANLEACINSVATQDYENIEIIVLDDESNDGTLEILRKLASSVPKMKFMQGKELPEGWLGKNWACHQLSQVAIGDFLLFIDADVRLKQNALSSALNLLKQKKSNSLSVFPTQEIKSFGESFITPIMNWLLLTFLPLNFVHTSKNNSFVAANGQFFLFEATLYNKIGGHKSVKNQIVEDMSLAKMIKSEDEKIVTCLGGSLVSCRMYKSFKDGFNGFSKNFFPGFNTSSGFFLLMLFFIQIVFLLPIVLNFLYPQYILHSLIIASMQFVVLENSRQKLIIAFLFPFQMIVLFLVGLNSLIKTLNGSLKWKDRKIF